MNSASTARADLFALFDMLLEFSEVLNRVGQIARCRDARGDIENREVGKEMLMHVPQTRQQHLAGSIDDLRSRSGGMTGLGFDTHNALVPHRDPLPGDLVRVYRVENRHVFDNEIARWMVNELIGHAPGAGGLRLFLLVDQGTDGTFKPFSHHTRPAAHSREDVVRVVEPYIGG